MWNFRLSLCLLFVLAAFCLPLHAQQPCKPPTLLTNSQQTNIFSEPQEVDLGDAIAEHLQRDFRIIDDDEVTGTLKRIGERLVKHLPPNNLRFQFFLVELPEANAFVLPGGRIYVSRKLIAFAQNEDEVAGVLAHEIGHLLARQHGIDMTRLFREVLGVRQVTDRKDIFEKYNQLVENYGRKPEVFGRGGKDEEQIVADQIGLFALASAGYNPQAFATFWDRFAETKGKTGGFFSNLFGTTKPEEKRLREIMKGLATLPASCIETRSAGKADEFQKWQTAVINYTGIGKKENLHAVLSKTVLNPPLRGETNHLRFSPDGKYILAQDDSGINVLTREPLTALFRIRAPEAEPAQFTPDSQHIVFHNTDLRVELWSIAEQKLKEAHELFIRKGALQSLLSPDGRTLACLDAELTLSLYDVASGAPVFQKKSFYTPSIFDMLILRLIEIFSRDDNEVSDLDWINMGFSADGHYFAAGQRSTNFNALGGLSTENAAMIFDLQNKTALSLKGNVKKIIANGFAFVGVDRLMGYNREEPNKSPLMMLPSCETVEQIPLGQFPMFNSKFAVATKGNYLIARPAAQYAVGVMNLATKKFFLGSKSAAIDIYDDVFLSERVNGEVGLYGVDKSDLRTKVVLPPNQLGRLRAEAISQDFNWVAVSERARGAIWDLQKGERVFHVRGFRGGHFGEANDFYADFPKNAQDPRQIGRLNLLSRNADVVSKLEEDRVRQYGNYLLVTKPAKKDGEFGRDIILEMHNAKNYSLMWSKPFPKEAPTVWVNGREEMMVLSWATSTKFAQDEIKKDAELEKKADAMKEKEGDYFLQILDAKTGDVKGRLLIETGKGSFRITNVFAAQDWVVISDSQNRVLVYSLSANEQKGKVFGGRATLSKAAGLLCVENQEGQLSLYDLATMEKRDQLNFSSPLSLTAFSADGKKLFVLTGNQIAYVFDVTAFGK
ncbi:MAG: M48 family metalloprotease [Acidobacteriota bacterium]